MKSLCWATLLVWVALAAGCASTSSPPDKPLTGDPLVDGPNAIQNGPPKDKVLWQYRMAAAAMQRGQYAEAKPVLDEALARIGGLFSADKGSKKARSYFTAEAKKTFLGEPYERVMAYYYRGILYWMDGEPDNARACFRSGQFHDGDTENKTYASDYVLLDYLDGLATVKLKGDGADAFKRAHAACKLAIPPEANPKANVLFFVDFGHGPTKFATGEYGEELRFRPGTSEAREVMIRIGSQAAHVGPYDDLNFQATTRGGRVMDHILGNKAVFKSATDAAGNIGLMSGMVLATQHDTEAVGLGLLAAGMFSKVLSASTRPEADTRSWDNLPLYLSFASIELPPGQHTATVEFLDANRKPIPKFTKTLTLNVPAGAGDKVVYVSDKSITPQTL
jgi:tetratricopeptide (TPR) repeat protein